MKAEAKATMAKYDVDMAAGSNLNGNRSSAELDDTNKQLKKMEDQAVVLAEVQDKVKKEICVQDAATVAADQPNKEEVNSCSTFVGNEEADSCSKFVGNVGAFFLDRANESLDDLSSDVCSRKLPSKRQRIGKSLLRPTWNNGNVNDKLILAIDEIKDHLGSIASSMMKSQDLEDELVHLRKMLLSEIAMLDGVSNRDVIDATRVLSRSSGEIYAFYSCPSDAWKKLYVSSVLSQLRGSSGTSRD